MVRTANMQPSYAQNCQMCHQSKLSDAGFGHIQNFETGAVQSAADLAWGLKLSTLQSKQVNGCRILLLFDSVLLVGLFVSAEGIASSKCCPAQVTLVGPLTRVNSLMIDKCALVSEGTHALVTLEGLLPGVGSLMSNQVAGAGKTCSAFHTGKWAKACVLP